MATIKARRQVNGSIRYTAIVRRRVLLVEELYRRAGQYEYAEGFNWVAIVALAAGAGTALVGLAVPSLRVLYDYSWFVGFAVAFTVYYALMNFQARKEPAPASF